MGRLLHLGRWLALALAGISLVVFLGARRGDLGDVLVAIFALRLVRVVNEGALFEALKIIEAVLVLDHPHPGLLALVIGHHLASVVFVAPGAIVRRPGTLAPLEYTYSERILNVFRCIPQRILHPSGNTWILNVF